ncbi:class I fructose-bisphosphate aldolase [Pseudonocardia sp.]|jgi:fructose-bisphosphate aldolase class I|uniref:class I fructose-bisphosphate aldolase n=3 Tax=Pseudonocardia sp. TaxID=60912 RepID=UPI003D12916E
MEALQRRTRRMFAFRKGILALDTAPDQLSLRFSSAGSTGPAPDAAAYRDMVLGTPNLASTTSAVVLPPEAFGPAASGSPRLRAVGSAAGPRGRGLLDRVAAAGVLLGVRADSGAESLSGGRDELVTTGLDGLSDRLRRFQALGASFAVWAMSSGSAIDYGALRTLTVNCQAAARFAYTCQTLGVVPVIRVGTRMRDGTPAQRSAARAAALLSVCGHLEDIEVDLPSVVLSTEAECVHDADPVTGGPLVALPDRLGGVALTAGDNALSTAVAAVTAVCEADPPWPVTFYLGREVTRPALLAWRGRTGSVRAGHQALRDGLTTACAALGGQALAAAPGS